MIPRVVIRNAFGSAFAQRLLAHALTHEQSATAGRVGAEGVRLDTSVRNALIIEDVKHFGPDFDARIDAVLPDVRLRLGVGPFVPAGKQLTMVAYGDGAFYAKHIDTVLKRSADDPVRQITFVYYFFNEPKAFAGGELRLFDLREDESADVAPEHDLLVAFPSWMSHEVLPVSCETGKYSDGRFAVNIWVSGTPERRHRDGHDAA